MRVAIVNLTGGGMSGGYRKYLQELVPRLQARPEISWLGVAIPSSVEIPAIEEELVARWPAGGYRSVRRWLQDWTASVRPDVVFIPTARWLPFDAPTVVMVRNMEPLVVPFGGNPLPESGRNLFRARAARQACRRATRVIAVSRFVRSFLEERWKIDRSKLGVVYHGVTVPMDAGEVPKNPVVAALAGRPFLFTAGSIRPARGLEDLILALGKMDRGLLIPLVIAGGVDPGMTRYAGRLKALAEGEGVAEGIVWGGSLSPGGMQWCYREATAFVMTSRTEACPNIALEAMACGVLPVSTNDPPMPEMFGEAAAFYAARDPESLARSLRTLLSRSDEERRALSARAITRAREFDWDRCASETLVELQKAADHGQAKRMV
jgi:glycosyltransferase involved in cell wall biosynthesis